MTGPGIVDAVATERFTGDADHPRQVVRVQLRAGAPTTVAVRGPGLTGSAVRTGGEAVVEVPVSVAGREPGEVLDAEVVTGAGRHPFRFPVAEPGWRLFLVPHFHYDPVFWNTQANYTEHWRLSGLPWEDPFQQPGLALVRAHLDRAEADPDYAFVLSELDYLKPYWDSFPADRERIRALLRAGRIELVGGAYNQPDSNLSGPETLTRNLIYGMAYHRHVVGARPRVGWQLDAFGHAPAFPALAAGAGLDAVVFARGPHHAWGPWWYKHPDIELAAPPGRLAAGDPPPSPAEYEWLAPSGEAVLAAYLVGHYHAGWWIDRAPDLEQAQEVAYDLFARLKPYAATRNVLLPIGTDYTPPNRWLPALVRAWNRRYAWPRFHCATPSAFVDAVRAEATGGRRRLVAQSRDLNPVFAGTYLAAIGGKLAHRAAEVAVTRAELSATLAAMLGASYPAEALDKAWRLLLFASHHDGVTGSHSDQVHLDLLGGWREACELAGAVHADALDAIAARVDTSGEGDAVVVSNPSSWPRTDLVRLTVPCDHFRGAGVRLRDQAGADVPFLAEEASRAPDGTLRELRLVFVAAGVPAAGYRVYRLVGADALPAGAAWTPVAGTEVSGGGFAVAADPATGGALTRLTDLATGTELLRGPGNELVAYRQHPDHPRFRDEGLWHVSTDGTSRSTAELPVPVRAERCAIGSRLLVRSAFAGGWRTQQVAVWAAVPRVEFTTRLDDLTDDVLIRARFGFDPAGVRPVCDTGGAVVSRGYGDREADTAGVTGAGEHAARWWCGLSPVPGAAEMIVPADHDPVVLRSLVAALTSRGSTVSVTLDSGPRHGRPAVDSNAPDLRIAIGGPDENRFTAEVLATAGPEVAAAFATAGYAFVPGDLPVLIAAGPEHATASPAERPRPYTVALLNRGTPGWSAGRDGTLALSLWRHDPLWPHGCWPGLATGGPTAPVRPTMAGGAPFDPFAGSHEFEYALVAGPGDWRDADVDRRAREYAMPLAARVVPTHPGDLPPSYSFLQVEPDTVDLVALKAGGDPLARHATPPGRLDEVVLRLRERHGVATRARVAFAVPPRRAEVADLLEERRERVPVTGAAVEVAVGAAATVTLAVAPAEPDRRSGRRLGPAGEPAQPIYARYWRHNAGPAPFGYQPLAVRIEPDQVVAPDGAVPAAVTVASAHTRGGPVAGRVHFDLPAGWRAAPPALDYRLAPGAHHRFAVTVQPPAGAPSGRYFVAARITDQLGQQHEDVLRIDRGAGPGGTDELGAELLTGPVRLAPGGSDRLRLRLRNHCRAELRGEAQVIAPFGAWPLFSPRTRPFRLPAGGESELEYGVAVPASQPAGSWWALLKVTWFGRCRYTSAIPVQVVRSSEGGTC